MQIGWNYRVLVLATTAIALVNVPAYAQEPHEGTSAMSDIIVTARRVEERLQDVPISITAFSQEALTRNNVTNLKDLATYTPGLSINSRYGSDNTTFTIRGFQQDQRTFSTVGTYFADVVMPRGSGGVQGGDGAGPGALFDLQNVQVLKGPQGTLFGRNVTGGAVLLVPNKPTSEPEGYAEVSAGDYDMWRFQSVVNLPVSENFRLRAGIDRMKRDGYLENIGSLGDGHYGNRGMDDVDYWALRVSAVADLTPDLENYTIVSYSNSKNNGVIAKVSKCYPAVITGGLAVGQLACDQIDRQRSSGFWTVQNALPDSASAIEQWQIINTTTWRASSSLTVKNIFSYGELRGRTDLDLFGSYFIVAGIPGQERPEQVASFAFSHSEATSGLANAQSTLVEELQFQGHPGDGRLVWQGGLYLELNDPLGTSGAQTASFTPCFDLAALDCVGPTPGVSLANGQFQLNRTTFRGYAAYGQASYDLTDNLKFTAGLRYTWDRMRSDVRFQIVSFGQSATVRCANATAPDFGEAFPIEQRFSRCGQTIRKSTEAPTWVIGLDYKPIEDMLLYVKYSRGYRQGGIAVFGPDPIQPFDAEKTDAYEAGAKVNWRGAAPGHFNISGFYNNLRNQQLLYAVACVETLPDYKGPCSSNAAIINAGKSRLYGFEAEFGISPFQGMRIEASYAYLNSKLQSATLPELPASSPYNLFRPPVVGDVIPNVQPHKATAMVGYTLPLPAAVGTVSIGGTYVFQGRYRAAPDSVAGSGNGILPASNIVNLNVNWGDIASLPLDASLFVTNLTKERVLLAVNEAQASGGFISYLLGEPRMWGLRLRYRFGS